MIKLKDILLEQKLPKFDIKKLPYADDIYKFIFGKPRPTSVYRNKSGSIAPINVVKLSSIEKVSAKPLEITKQFNNQIKWLESNKNSLYGRYSALKPGDIEVQMAIIGQIQRLVEAGKIEDAISAIECCIQKASDFEKMYNNLLNLVKSGASKKLNKGIAVERGTVGLMTSNKNISNIGNAPPGNNKKPDIWFTYKGNPYAFEVKENFNAPMGVVSKKWFDSFYFNRQTKNFEGKGNGRWAKRILKTLQNSDVARNNMEKFFNTIYGVVSGIYSSGLSRINLKQGISGPVIKTPLGTYEGGSPVMKKLLDINKQILSPSTGPKGGNVYVRNDAALRRELMARKADNGAMGSYIVIGDIGKQQIWHLEDDVLKLGTNLFAPPNIMLEARFKRPGTRKNADGTLSQSYHFDLGLKHQYIKKGDMPVQGGIPFDPATFLNK